MQNFTASDQSEYKCALSLIDGAARAREGGTLQNPPSLLWCKSMHTFGGFLLKMFELIMKDTLSVEAHVQTAMTD